MTALRDVREGLEARLDTISGLRRADAQINPPAYSIALSSSGIEPHQAFASDAGLTDWTFSVVIYVSTSFTPAARNNLDEYCDLTGTKSVIAAIEADPTLGGISHDLSVRSITQGDFIMREADATHAYLGAEFTVTVHGV